METQKPNGEKSAYTGRFAASAAPKKRTGAASTHRQSADTPRRPSGFGAAPKSNRAQKTATGVAQAVKPKETDSPRKEKKPRPVQQPREKKDLRGFKIVLALLVAALILYLLIALIFGGQKRTVHQLPIVERESISEFAPEETPLPGTEVQ